MHIPDGFLSVPVSGALWAASAGAVGASVRRLNQDSEPLASGHDGTVLMGVAAAFIFVAQMFNFPISGGTTGHLLGAALATALVGPWRAILVMTAVFLIQAFVFADGGLVVLGANTFNMGVSGCLLAGLLLPRLSRLLGGKPGSRLAAIAVTAWSTVMLAAGLTAVELALSGTIAAGIVVPAMLGVHAVIGVGEALLTVAAYSLLVGARPDLLTAGALAQGDAARRGLEAWRIAAVMALGLVIVRLAFPHPDGLEYVAEQLGFAGRAGAAIAAPLADYAIPGRDAGAGFDWLGAYASAIVGMVLCAAAMVVIGGGRKRAPELQAAAE